LTNVKTLLLTRPKAQSRALAQKIETEFPDKATCLISPLMAITPVGRLPDTSKFQAMLFTSANGVQAFIDSNGTTRKCYCVGTRTTRLAQAAGLDAVSANGAAAELVALVATDLDPEDGPLLYVRGEHTVGGVADNLSEQGFTVEQTVLYRQETCDLSRSVQTSLAHGEVQGLPLYSPLTARRFAEVLAKNPEWPTQNLTALCISENVAAEVNNLEFGRVEIAAKPNGTEMLALIGRFLR
jgi:uroporphyrinogen-III synthase